MSTYQVQHLDNPSSSFTRPCIFQNPHHIPNPSSASSHPDPAIEAFHRTLPSYAETALHNLPSIASELGLKHVFLKDESTRFGLPAFKILGASWAIHRSLIKRLSLKSDSSLDDVKEALSQSGSDNIRLVTCSEGNWGRACARMGRVLDVHVTVYVPGFMSEYTRNLLREEGAEVKVLDDGSYDDAIAATREDAKRTGALMVMDTSWEGYEEVPKV
jgi:diaminopropionate ammonia-lyase